MSNFSASNFAASMESVNAELEAVGFGPGNFSVPAYAGPSPAIALLHAWGDPVFEAAVAAIPGVTITQGDDPIDMTTAAADGAGATWGQDAAPLAGTVSPGLYVDAEGVLWWVIQTYNTAVYPDPIAIPALIRRAKIPGEVLPWVQPLDQYDAYKLANPFTGEPDQCTHNGQTWTVIAADGSGNNVWEPGVFGWAYPGFVPPPGEDWVDTGATITAQFGTVYQLSATLTGLSIGQPLRLGPTAETTFNGYYPVVGTPSAIIQINPFVQVATGLKVWKWA